MPYVDYADHNSIGQGYHYFRFEWKTSEDAISICDRISQMEVDDSLPSFSKTISMEIKKRILMYYK
jgi:hypothetical protein